KLGVNQGKKGEILVSPQSQTSVDNIYAVGDVTDRANLTPVAIREGNAVAETLFNDNPMAVDHNLIPTAVFSQPEIGTIGLTEAQAREEYDSIDVYVSNFRPMKNILAGSESKMLMKLVVDQKTDKMLGVHIMGDDAGEMIQLVGVAMRMGATKADFDATMAVHPTASEELVTMKVPTRS
ncbi:MAG: FAD-dependent oxidoreductase, partial [Rhizobiales bacterium]|nr:FAD-dependent oxidoreductase [Hyphomicrobiales bacterium]